MEKELLNSDYSLRSSWTNCGSCFTHHGHKNPGGADQRSGVFPPLMYGVKKFNSELVSIEFFASCSKLHADVVDVCDVGWGGAKQVT